MSADYTMGNYFSSIHAKKKYAKYRGTGSDRCYPFNTVKTGDIEMLSISYGDVEIEIKSKLIRLKEIIQQWTRN